MLGTILQDVTVDGVELITVVVADFLGEHPFLMPSYRRHRPLKLPLVSSPHQLERLKPIRRLAGGAERRFTTTPTAMVIQFSSILLVTPGESILAGQITGKGKRRSEKGWLAVHSRPKSFDVSSSMRTLAARQPIKS